MNLGEALVRQLHDFLKKESQGSDKERQYVFETLLDTFKIMLTVKDFDKFSFVLERVELSQPGQQRLSIDKLQHQAEALINKITYLLEPFRLVELDAANLKIQLRSKHPEKQGSKISFYEILLVATPAQTFVRYQYDNHDQVRKPQPFHVTNEILVKLINDMTVSLES